MKKIYEDIHFVCGKSSEDFITKLSTAIDDYQSKGYQVDVQYSLGSNIITALVLSYKGEK